jgi:hypothetical protein
MTHINLVQRLGYTPIDAHPLADDRCAGKAWKSISYIVAEVAIQGKCPSPSWNLSRAAFATNYLPFATFSSMILPRADNTPTCDGEERGKP